MKVRANWSWVNIKGGVSWGAGVYVGITENHVELMFPEWTDVYHFFVQEKASDAVMAY